MNAIKALLLRPVAYQPAIAQATGSVKLTILWCQLYYWKDKADDPAGWIYKTREAIYEETGLTRKEQETARDLGETLGVLKSEVRGSPPTVHFQVNEDRMIELLERLDRKDPKKKRTEKGKPESSIEWLKQIPAEDMRALCARFDTDETCIRARADDVIDYCESKGKKYSNYKAALRNFIKSHIERHGKKGSAIAPKKADIEELVNVAKQMTANDTGWTDMYARLKAAGVRIKIDGSVAAYTQGKWRVLGASGWVDWGEGLNGYINFDWG